MWPKEGASWTRVHMDHAHIRDIGLFLILVDSFFGWPEIIKARDRKATTVRQIFRTIFARNGVPKITDNAQEFCDESLLTRLRKIAERMVQTVKMGLKNCFFSSNLLNFALPFSRLRYSLT